MSEVSENRIDFVDLKNALFGGTRNNENIPSIHIASLAVNYANSLEDNTLPEIVN